VLWWSQWSSLTTVRTRCSASILYCLNFLTWFYAFDFIKNVKYASDRKFTEVRVPKATDSKRRARTDPLAFWVLVSIQYCVKTVSIDYYLLLTATMEASYYSVDNSVCYNIYCGHSRLQNVRHATVDKNTLDRQRTAEPNHTFRIFERILRFLSYDKTTALKLKLDYLQNKLSNAGTAQQYKNNALQRNVVI